MAFAWWVRAEQTAPRWHPPERGQDSSDGRSHTGPPLLGTCLFWKQWPVEASPPKTNASHTTALVLCLLCHPSIPSHFALFLGSHLRLGLASDRGFSPHLISTDHFSGHIARLHGMPRFLPWRNCQVFGEGAGNSYGA